MKTFGILALGGAMGVQFEDLTYNNLREAYMEVSDKNDCWTNFDPLWIRFNPTIQAVPKVYGNKNLDTAIIGNDYLPYFKWCDANGDGSVALFESARCGSKSGFWYPAQVGWFDWATYATSISLEFSQIMMKYMDNIDRDHSMSLDQSEFAWHYAAMTHTSAEAVFALLDENKDGKLTGKSPIDIIFVLPVLIYGWKINDRICELDFRSEKEFPVFPILTCGQKLNFLSAI